MISGTTTSLAGIVVILAGLFLIGQAAFVAVAQKRAERFLLSFASSPRAHYLEQALRLVAGLGFVWFSPQMKYHDLFLVFGWVLVVTSIVLLLLPWRFHQRFATWSIPMVIARIKLYALASFGLGAFVLFALFP